MIRATIEDWRDEALRAADAAATGNPRKTAVMNSESGAVGAYERVLKLLAPTGDHTLMADAQRARALLVGNEPGMAAVVKAAAVVKVIDRLMGALERDAVWIADLQSRGYVNCVYCGHRYGPGETTPVTMAEALKVHIARCPSHPMAQQREILSDLVKAVTVEVNEKGAGGYLLARLSDARKALAATGDDRGVAR
jgi:hypothetical protein